MAIGDVIGIAVLGAIVSNGVAGFSDSRIDVRRQAVAAAARAAAEPPVTVLDIGRRRG